MSTPASGSEPKAEGLIGIGALARAAGVPVETLRTWERRYGVPEAVRTPSGHRLYPLASIEHVRLIAAAIEGGHRAAQATNLSVSALRELVGQPAPEPAAVPAPVPPQILSDPAALLDYAAHLDSHGLADALRAEMATRGLLPFLENVLAPFLSEVGEAWARGAITEAHEHAASELVRDILAGVWRDHSPPPGAAVALFACLPGDHHSLGLYMASAAATLAGADSVMVGASTPLQAIVGAAREVKANAVVVSISAAFDTGGARQILLDLRRALDRSTVLLVGGAGAPDHVPGVAYPGSLGGLVQALSALRAAPT